MLTLICALTRNRAIGRNNSLLFYLPDDLKHFKQLTTGHTIIMGRKTFQSLPKGALPNRRNIVLSRNPAFGAIGIEVYDQLDTALAHCKPTEQVFIIGGHSVYQSALPLAQRLCLTEIDAEVDNADVFFPEWSQAEWEIVNRQFHPIDERHAVPFHFTEYQRKK